MLRGIDHEAPSSLLTFSCCAAPSEASRYFKQELTDARKIFLEGVAHFYSRSPVARRAMPRHATRGSALVSSVDLHVSRKRSVIIYWRRNASGLEKVREGVTSSPARETRSLSEVWAQSKSIENQRTPARLGCSARRFSSSAKCRCVPWPARDSGGRSAAASGRSASFMPTGWLTPRSSMVTP